MSQLKITDDLKLWLNEILSVYVSPEVAFTYSKRENFYYINYEDKTIQFQIIESLWDINNKNPLIRVEDDFVYFDQQSQSNTSLFQDHKIHYDILGLVYWVLTRIEEIGRDEKLLDSIGRFPATSSHAYRHQYLHRPIVDEWFSALRSHLKKIWPNLKLTKHTYMTVPSHDIDQPAYTYFRSPLRLIHMMITDLLRTKRIRHFISAPFQNYKKRTSLPEKDCYNSFDWLMNVSEKNNLTSYFYFQAGLGNHYRDAHYSLLHPAIQKLITSIIDRGHKVGLHPSYRTFLSPDRIKKETDHLTQAIKKAIGKELPFGARMHFLRWRSTDTLKALDEAGLIYDTTLGYADQLGFRCGTCREYPAFDPLSQKRLNIKIKPLIVMDQTIISEKYLNLGYDKKSLMTVLNYKKACQNMKGNFTILWHNSTLETEEQKRYYKAIIEGNLV